MIRKTIAGLTAIVASVSAIQAEAQVDATAEWGYGGYHNPWAVQQQPSYGGYFGGSSYGYGDSKVTKLQRDVSYLVKKNSALTASLTTVTDRLVAAEAAITALQEAGPGTGGTGGSTDLGPIEARVTALETKSSENMMAIADNDSDIAGLDTLVADNASDITVLDMMVSANMQSLAANAGSIAANMMSIGTNSAAVAAASATAIDSAQLATMVSTINASIAANTATGVTNAAGVAANSAAVATNAAGVAANTAAIASIPMTSSDPAVIAALQAGISANSVAIASSGAGSVATLSAQIAANMASIGTLNSTVATNTAGVATNSAGIQANSVRITSNATAQGGLQTSLGFLSFQVQDNLVSNLRQDTQISTNSANIIAS